MRGLLLLAMAVLPITLNAEITFTAGEGLDASQINKIKNEARSNSGEYAAGGFGLDGMNEADMYQQLGISAVTPLGGDSSGYTATRKGVVTYSCNPGAFVSMADLNGKVTDCSSGAPKMDLCDAMSRGFDCSKYTVSATLSGDQTVNVTDSDKVPALFGIYRLITSCEAEVCETQYWATSEASAPTSAEASLVMDDKVKQQHMGDDSMFGQYLSLMQSDKAAAMRKDAKEEGHSECFQQQMGQLENGGKVNVNCDPQDPRSLSFTVDQREGENYGDLMCERTETGSCDLPTPIHDYKIHEGQQICTAKHNPTPGLCWKKTSIITTENFISEYGYSRRRATVTDCGTSYKAGIPYKCNHVSYRNYSYYGNNTITDTPRKSDNVVLIPVPLHEIDSIKIKAGRVDDYLRVIVADNAGSATNKNHDVYVLNTNWRWGTGNDDGNNSMGWVDITQSVKGIQRYSDSKEIHINAAVWTVGSGDYDMDIQVIYKKYKHRESVEDQCLSFEARKSPPGVVGGCYEHQAGVCLESGNKVIHGEVFNSNCWNFQRYFTCYDNAAQGCNTSLLTENGWTKKEERNKQYPISATGQDTSMPWSWDEVWTYNGTEGTNQFGCAPSTSTSTRTDATGGTIKTTHQWCYKEKAGECKPSPPETTQEITVCGVTSVSCNSEQNGLCVSQKQNWECETKYVCKGAFGNSLEDESAASDNLKALGTVLAASEKAAAVAEGLAKSMSVGEDGSITVFAGEEERCYKMSSKTIDYANATLIGLGASALTADFGPAAIIILNFTQIDRQRRNCCVPNPQAVPMNANFGFCDQGDIQLAAARLSNRAHQVVVGGNEFNIDDVTATPAAMEVKTVCTSIPGQPGSQTCSKYLVGPDCAEPASCGTPVMQEASGREYVDGDCSAEGGAPQTCRTYIDQLQQNGQTVSNTPDPVTSGDTGTGWIKGNRRGCYFTLGTKGQTPFTINHPGSMDRYQWASSSSPFNMPFSCRYSIFDVVETFQIDHYQSWCVYDSILAKIVHQQGRQQLAAHAASPATGGATKEFNFSFYGYPAPGWTAQNLVNGNDVRFWQWDAKCSATGTEQQKAAAHEFIGQQAATTQGCPFTPDVYVAICDKAGTCGALPFNPALEVTNWQVFRLKAEDLGIRALTPLTVIEGGCNASGVCRYKAHAWKKGVGGTVNIPLDLNWALNSANHGWGANYITHNTLHFMAYTAPIGEVNTPKLMKCIGSAAVCKSTGEGPWTTVDLQNPTALTGQNIHGSPEVTATGQCSAKTNSCAYRLNIRVALTAKPWHRGLTHDSKKYNLRPKILGEYMGSDTVRYNYDLKTDCSGFTLDEFMAIDMNAVDLSEFEEAMVAEAEAKMSQMMTEGFLDNMTASTNSLIAGASLPADEVGRKNFQLSPTNGYPGTEVKLRVALGEGDTYRVVRDGVETLYPVSTYEIDWGDGAKVVRNVQNTLPATHTYGNAQNPPSSNRTITGTITWTTSGGQFSDRFTYQMWVTASGTEGGGDVIPGGAGNKPSGTPDTKSEVRIFNELDSSLKGSAPSEW